jgi:hypothetical protein
MANTQQPTRHTHHMDTNHFAIQDFGWHTARSMWLQLPLPITSVTPSPKCSDKQNSTSRLM